MGMTFVTEDEPDLTIPEDTLVRAKLVDIKPKTINWNDRKTGEAKSRNMLEWWFEVTDSRFPGRDGGTRKIKGECDAKISNHPGNKFRAWAETLLGREIPVGMGIDTDDILGLACDITVVHEKSSKANDDRVFERLDQVIAIDGGFALSDQPPF
jgi:hypothetical protein